MSLLPDDQILARAQGVVAQTFGADIAGRSAFEIDTFGVPYDQDERVVVRVLLPFPAGRDRNEAMNRAFQHFVKAAAEGGDPRIFGLLFRSPADAETAETVQ
jgi:hypothetical protein